MHEENSQNTCQDQRFLWWWWNQTPEGCWPVDFSRPWRWSNQPLQMRTAHQWMGKCILVQVQRELRMKMWVCESILLNTLLYSAAVGLENNSSTNVSRNIDTIIVVLNYLEGWLLGWSGRFVSHGNTKQQSGKRKKFFWYKYNTIFIYWNSSQSTKFSLKH